MPLLLGFWLVRGNALGPICGLSARQLNSCLPRREEEACRLVTAKSTGPQDHTGPELTDWPLPLKGTAGRNVSANKQTSERNDAKPVISANTGHRATFWVINIDTDPPLAKLII